MTPRGGGTSGKGDKRMFKGVGCHPRVMKAPKGDRMALKGDGTPPKGDKRHPRVIEGCSIVKDATQESLEGTQG